MPKTPRQLPFDWYRSSDIDGDAHLIVDAAKADLTGWHVEMTTSSGDRKWESFELNTAGRQASGELSLNPYLPVEEMVPAWLLYVGGGDVGDVIAPDGTRY